MSIFIYSLALFSSTMLWAYFPPLLAMVSGWNPGLGNEEARQKAMLIGLALGFLSSLWLARQPGKPSPWKLKLSTAACGLTFMALSFLLIQFRMQLFGSPIPFGPRLSVAAFLFPALIFAAFCLAKDGGPGAILAAAWLAWASVTLLQIFDMPLNSGFSDMLPLLKAAGASFLRGESPYGIQGSPLGSLRCSYLPGTWLSYLPAVMGDFDPRFLNLAYMALASGIFFNALGEENKIWGACLAALFLLSPWFQFRSELYLAPYLATWAWLYWAEKRGREAQALAAFGLGLSFHPFSWALLPAWSAWRFFGGRLALLTLAKVLLLPALFFSPFLIWDAKGFFEGVVMHWAGSYEWSHYNLVWWTGHSPAGLVFLSVLQISALLLACWQLRGMGLGGFFGVATALLAALLLASYHTSHYFFFVVAWLGMISLAEARPRSL